jgi:hypothetical protein
MQKAACSDGRVAGTGVAALVSIEPSEVDDDDYKAAKKKTGRKKPKAAKSRTKKA